MPEFRPYDKRALEEIHSWKNPHQGSLGSVMDALGLPFDKAADFAMEMPGVGWAIEKSIHGLVSLTNDVAQWTIRPDAIHKEFRNAGYDEVHRHQDVAQLNLEDVDAVIGWLGLKYKGLAAGEGGAAGATGVTGIPPDIMALLTLNLRAIGEYATYCGFDVSSQHERLFALNILGLASSPSDSSKGVAMAQLIKIGKEVAKKKTWKELERHTFVKIVQQIAKALGIRLTKAKLAQVVPVTGAVFGSGFNVYFTTKVCNAAYYLYRERFLANKYGPAVISGEAADDLTGEYPETDETIPTDTRAIASG